MKRLILLTLCIVILTTFAMHSQTTPQSTQKQQQQQQQTQIVLKPKFLGADLVFALNAMNNIEISGSEVDNFLTCKNFLKESIQKLQDAKKTVNDTITVDLPFNIAQKLVDFLERAKFAGAQAEQYKRFFEAILEATKPFKKQ